MTKKFRGYSTFPGLVDGEACRVRLLPFPSGIDYVGRPVPEGLFERDLQGYVLHAGDKRDDGNYEAIAMLTDPWLEMNIDPFLHRMFNKEPPSPFPYRVMPVHFLNGWTREAELKPGSDCYIWIRPEGNIPWLKRAPDMLPSAFPDYPRELLQGFWRAEVKTIVRAREPTSVRVLRAVFTDPRIERHSDPRVRALFRQEPWMAYTATLTDESIAEAAGEMANDVSTHVLDIIAGLSEIKLFERWFR